MGYIILLIVGLAVVIGLLVMFVGGKRRPTGQVSPGNDVTQKVPGAEEANPAASSTAPSNQVNTAQKHTPPA
jgi:hypothetical protein